jgi:glycosyltransferase involved in cell wall biosynthesis
MANARVDLRQMISLVIPAYNEALLLPRLLGSVRQAEQVFQRSGGRLEVIVADNCSTDETVSVAERYGCRVVPVVPPCIAAVRSAGARAASGDILGFVDADAMIHPERFVKIARVLAPDSAVIAGSTGVRLERWSIGIALTYALHLRFLWLTKMDTGVVFCRREDLRRSAAMTSVANSVKTSRSF